MSLGEELNTWERVAADVGPGWDVLKFDPSAGETSGVVEAKPELHGGVFRVSVRWQLGGSSFEDVVEASTSQRAVSYLHSSVLMSGVGSSWLFRPHAAPVSEPAGATDL